MAEIVENACRTILRRVGISLIAFGLFDVGVMVYCIINRINYCSSFNVFAVLALSDRPGSARNAGAPARGR